jgi:hypothetical protein
VRVIWRDSWAIHGIGLLSLTKTDSANFPSDFNLPVVISLLDYLECKYQAFVERVPNTSFGSRETSRPGAQR